MQNAGFEQSSKHSSLAHVETTQQAELYRLRCKEKYSLHSYSSLAQSVEHMTVNHGVVGSSPTGGARKKDIAYAVPFFLAPSRCAYHQLPISALARIIWVRSRATSVSSLCERESLGSSFVVVLLTRYPFFWLSLFCLMPTPYLRTK